jgi:two-component system, OmpR family, response regulator
MDYDLLVLDLNLPRLDRVAVLKHVRSHKASVPILILTARGRPDDRWQCLDFGADDYLVNPFSFSELSARIRALLRRSRLPSESVLTVEDLKLDRVERQVTRGNRGIDLTSKNAGRMLRNWYISSRGVSLELKLWCSIRTANSRCRGPRAVLLPI